MPLVKIAGSTEEIEANEICDMCGEAVHIPPEAIRCEWGCCYIDASAKQLNPATRERQGRPWHECSACAHETHRFDAKALLRMYPEGKGYLVPRRGQMYNLMQGQAITPLKV